MSEKENSDLINKDKIEEVSAKNVIKINVNEKNDLKPEDSKINNNIENMPLNSTWTFWYASRKEKDHHIPYCDRLKKIAEFNTMQDFFKYYFN